MRGPQFSRISRIHLQNLGAKMVAWSQFHAEEPQSWCDALTCYSVRVHGYTYSYIRGNNCNNCAEDIRGHSAKFIRTGEFTHSWYRTIRYFWDWKRILLLLQALQLQSLNVLPLLTYNFHLLRAWMWLVQFFIFNFFMSFLISSYHLFFGLPSCHVNIGFHLYTFFYHSLFRHSL